jgi:carbamoyl-phosphate synthase large subunit
VGRTFGEAFVKSQLGASVRLPTSGKVFLSVKNSDKPRAVQVAKDLLGMGFSVVATKGTAAAIAARSRHHGPSENPSCPSARRPQLNSDR